MKALILAAGYATRLYPLTKDYPKALLEVNKRPLIDFIIDKVSVVEAIDEIIVVTNSKFFEHFHKWSVKINTDKVVTVVDDMTSDLSQKKGAIADMQFAIQKRRINDDLLVIGGDNLFDGDVNLMLDFARLKNKSPVIAVFDIKDKSQASKYGLVQIDDNGKVVEFQEKPQVPASTLVAMCLYYFPREKLGLVKEYLSAKENKKDALGFYIDWLMRKEDIFAYKFGGKWYDIGDKKFYQHAKESFITNKARK
ncbi:MAG: nucleotidyltransferase family protein [Candidatus Omnitrophica bacterium]|jgi:glucose-1-phosphate thymidylyltransferase|nr:nucleotidyltransferase family protein [Candidatus Omnitrophota bacterium]